MLKLSHNNKKRNIVPVFGTMGLAVRFTCVNVWDLVEMWM